MSTNYKPDEKSLTDWISQSEAARLRGTTRQAIHRLIQNGRLSTLTVGKTRFVSRTDVLNFLPTPAGRKSVK